MTIPPFAKPIPRGVDRREAALHVRLAATKLAKCRQGQVTMTNGEETLHKGLWPLQFTKGLPHDKAGFVDAKAYELFVEYINTEDDGAPFAFEVPLGPDAQGTLRNAYRPASYQPTSADIPTTFATTAPDGTSFGVRRWASARAGHVYDLEGADSDTLAIDAAPALGSSELTAEMAELYGMALLRDVPLEMISAATAMSPRRA